MSVEQQVKREQEHSEVDEFLAARRQAIFATSRKDGPPQLSPVWYVWEDGVFYVSTSSESLKARNISLDRRISVCIDGGLGDYRYVVMSGEVEIEPYLSDLQQSMRYQIIRKYHDSDESAQAYFDESADVDQIIFILKPSRIIFKDLN